MGNYKSEDYIKRIDKNFLYLRQCRRCEKVYRTPFQDSKFCLDCYHPRFLKAWGNMLKKLKKSAYMSQNSSKRIFKG